MGLAQSSSGSPDFLGTCRILLQGRWLLWDLFSANQGVMQGGPFSPCISNVMVDAIVCKWIRQVLGDEAENEGIGAEICSFLVAFCTDDGIIQARCPEMLQSSFDILIALFERVGLRTNTQKTKAMICIPGRIRARHTVEVYNNQQEGLISCKTWLCWKVDCDICGVQVTAASLNKHLDT